MDWDVFICHAGEDKTFVRKLAQELSRFGIRVWYDEFMLKAGDSLLRTIDDGLRRSTYGIVLISPNFLLKNGRKRIGRASGSRRSRWQGNSSDLA
jgi:hypothetical protein